VGTRASVEQERRGRCRHRSSTGGTTAAHWAHVATAVTPEADRGYAQQRIASLGVQHTCDAGEHAVTRAGVAGRERRREALDNVVRLRRRFSRRLATQRLPHAQPTCCIIACSFDTVSAWSMRSFLKDGTSMQRDSMLFPVGSSRSVGTAASRWCACRGSGRGSTPAADARRRRSRAPRGDRLDGVHGDLPWRRPATRAHVTEERRSGSAVQGAGRCAPTRGALWRGRCLALSRHTPMSRAWSGGRSGGVPTRDPSSVLVRRSSRASEGSIAEPDARSGARRRRILMRAQVLTARTMGSR
jgi:hypothetical protein